MRRGRTSSSENPGGGSRAFGVGDRGQGGSGVVGAIKQGRYTLGAAGDLKPGTYLVEIAWQKKTGRQILLKHDPPNVTDETRQVVRKKYNVNSKQTVEVKPGANTFNFTLTSK
jgi:hypothetical protein